MWKLYVRPSDPHIGRIRVPCSSRLHPMSRYPQSEPAPARPRARPWNRRSAYEEPLKYLAPLTKGIAQALLNASAEIVLRNGNPTSQIFDICTLFLFDIMISLAMDEGASILQTSALVFPDAQYGGGAHRPQIGNDKSACRKLSVFNE